MSDIIGFLRTYGGRHFDEMPLCDVDLLIFAQLSYCDFRSAAAGDTLCAAAKKLLRAEKSADATEQRFQFQAENDERLLLWTAASLRYETVSLRAFERRYDAENTQFAALCLRADGRDIVIYRGTDNTLAGWKEDFDLCFRLPVAAQEEALRFCERMAADGDKPLILCGHSKGGGLALYAALYGGEALRARIAQVISFDGVGMPESELERFESDGAYAEILSRIRVILPEASVVGVIFPQPGQVRTVDCRMVSLLQHYPFNWVVNGADFLDSERTIFSRAAAIAMDEFLSQLSLPEREEAITLIYEIIRATKAQTLEELLRGWIRNTVPVAKTVLEKLDTDNAKLYLKVVTAFYRALGRTAGVLLGGDEEPAEEKG